MRARIGALLFAFGIFALASRGHAAAINIDVVQQGPGSTLWNLQLSGTGLSVGALSLRVSDSLTSFTPSPWGRRRSAPWAWGVVAVWIRCRPCLASTC